MLVADNVIPANRCACRRCIFVKNYTIMVRKAKKEEITIEDVRSEMRKVTWPSRTELRNYSVAVIVMLVIFGVAIWAIDTLIVGGLVAFTGLRG